jgi:hypothetical protein
MGWTCGAASGACAFQIVQTPHLVSLLIAVSGNSTAECSAQMHHAMPTAAESCYEPSMLVFQVKGRAHHL